MTTDAITGYINACADALAAAGYTITAATAWLTDWPLTGQIELDGPVAACPGSRRYPVLSWTEEYGWNAGLVHPDRITDGIQGRRYADIGVAPTPERLTQWYRAWEHMPDVLGAGSPTLYRQAPDEEMTQESGEIYRILAEYAGGDE